ncbi:PD-(D/E)XK nuclease domain-containing protein, partial [Mediterraneibacter glycyrrhizinilyticus]
YDIMLEPQNIDDPAIIIEFKIQDPEEEKKLSQTVEAALQQIETKNYAVELVDKGIQADRIRKYGFAFCGKIVEIRKEKCSR